MRRGFLPRRAFILHTALVLAFLLGAAVPGLAAEFPVEDTPLTSPGMVFELNRNGTGQIIVSDYDAHQVWRVDALTGAYTRYTVPGTVVDARPDSQGNIWYTNATSTLSRINTQENPVTVTQWSLYGWNPAPADLYNINGLAFDSDGNLWITEWEGRSSLLYRLNTGTGELCGYTLSYGSASYYALAQGLNIWLINLNQDRAVRFDPLASTRTWWQLPVGAAEGLALDAAGNLWWADQEAGALGRLEPALKTVTTWALPLGTTPHMVADSATGIWYTAGEEGLTGTLGVLDPAAALPAFSGEVLQLTYSVAAPACAPIGAGSTAAVAVDAGTLDWTPDDWAVLQDTDGWQIYGMPEGSIPYGLALESGRAWTGDYGRQVLARTGTSGIAAPLLTIALSGTADILLSWNAVPGASLYQVWRSESPYFVPAGTPYSEITTFSPPTITFPDYGVAADDLHNYTYIVRAANSAGLASANSNRVAEFTFTLEPGVSP